MGPHTGRGDEEVEDPEPGMLALFGLARLSLPAVTQSRVSNPLGAALSPATRRVDCSCVPQNQNCDEGDAALQLLDPAISVG